MSQVFYISKDGKQLGPWSKHEVLQHLQSQQVDWADYIYDEAKADWILVSEHTEFFHFFSKVISETSFETLKSQSVYGATKAGPKGGLEWFVLKGENKYGPFSYLEMVRLLQEKNLFEYDYVWNSGLSSWRRVAECDSFHPDQIRALHKEKPADSEEVFFRRRHARAQYGASVIVHNNKDVWKGESVEISAGGAGLMLSTTSLQPGQTVFLHFKVGDEVPPFNAVCSVVSKQILPDGATVKYGMKFTNISRDVQDAIQNFTVKVA